MPDYELAEVELVKVIEKWQKKHGIKTFEATDIILRHWISLYHKEHCEREVKQCA